MLGLAVNGEPSTKKHRHEPRRETAGPADLAGLGDFRGDDETVGPDDLPRLLAEDVTVDASEIKPLARRFERPPDGASAYDELLGRPALEEEMKTGLEKASAAAHVGVSPPLKSCLSSLKKKKKTEKVTFSDESAVAEYRQDDPAATTPRAEGARRAPLAGGPKREPLSDQQTRENDATIAKWTMTIGVASPSVSSRRRRSGTFTLSEEDDEDDMLTPIEEEPRPGLVDRLRTEARRLDCEAARARAAMDSWKTLDAQADELQAAARRLKQSALAATAAAAPSTRRVVRPAPMAPFGWSTEASASDDVVFEIPHPLYGTQLELQLALKDSPRLIARHPIHPPVDDVLGAVERSLARRCLAAPCFWYHPRARKTPAGFEVALASHDDAPTDLERCGYFAAKLSCVAREVFDLETRHDCSLRFVGDTIELDVSLLGPASLVTLGFRLRRGYPDPASRHDADAVRRNDDLLSCRAPDLAPSLRSLGFLAKPHPDHLPPHDDGFLPAAMPVPGAVLAITQAARDLLWRQSDSYAPSSH